MEGLSHNHKQHSFHLGLSNGSMTFRGQDVLIVVSQRADIHMYLLF